MGGCCSTSGDVRAVQNPAAARHAHDANHAAGSVPVHSKAYYNYRKQADEEAKKRGQCFEASKKAYAQNRKADAKSLSEEGHKHDARMKEANAKAAEEILRVQNLAKSDTIDLHGLKVQEALDATKAFIVDKVKHKYGEIHIITGAGHHSDPKKGPVIKPAVLKLLKEQGYHPHKDNDGKFSVDVRKKK